MAAPGPDLEVTMQTEEVYDPPEEFRANSEFNDEAVYAQAEADPERLVGILGREAQVE